MWKHCKNTRKYYFQVNGDDIAYCYIYEEPNGDKNLYGFLCGINFCDFLICTLPKNCEKLTKSQLQKAERFMIYKIEELKEALDKASKKIRRII